MERQYFNFDSDASSDVSDSGSSQSDDSFDEITFDNTLIDLSTRKKEKDSFEITDDDSEEEDEEDESLLQQSTTDPFGVEIPEEAQKRILQLLSGSDLKSASLVSKLWYHKISKSETFAMKLDLKVNFLNNESIKEEDLPLLLRSTRRFSNVHIAIKNSNSINKSIDKILSKFASSIVHLKLEKIGGFNTILNKAFPFFKLESLDVHVSCGRLSCNFGYIQSLKQLSVDGLDPNALSYCFVQNPQLEELTLYENSFINYFEQDITTFSLFRLKKLSIFDHLQTPIALDNEFPANKWEPKTRIHYMKFLKLHSNSLTTLRMGNCFAEDLNRIIRSLSNLSCLEIDKLDGDSSKLKFMKNKSITTFIADEVKDEMIQFVANSFINLRSIFIGKVSTHHFFFTVVVSQKLERFSYFWASANLECHGFRFINLKELFDKVVKESRRAQCNRSIEIKTSTKENFLKTI